MMLSALAHRISVFLFLRRIRRKLPAAKIARHGRRIEVQERFADLDGRWYWIVYRCEGPRWRTKAATMERPFTEDKEVAAGYSCHDSHLHEDGTLCLASPNYLKFEAAVERAHFWANCYSFLMQHGLPELKRLVPEW